MSTLTADRILTGRPQPTVRFTGYCQPCQLPASATVEGNGDRATIVCRCGALVDAERIYGAMTAGTCDQRCEGATGPICECACGGANHGGGWSTYTEIPASVLEAYAKAQARTAAKREAAAERRRGERARAYAAQLEEYPGLAALAASELGAEDLGIFLCEMREKLEDREVLSPRQAEAAARVWAQRSARAAQRATRQARKAAEAQPVPTGKAIVVEGEIVFTKYQDSDAHRNAGALKMLVVSTGGWKAWATVPRSLLPVVSVADIQALKGRRVRFTADVALGFKDPDPSFGFASRPRDAVFTDAQEG